MSLCAYTGAAIFDGHALHYRHAALVENGVFMELAPEDHVPTKARAIPLGGGTILPGFVDLQVNGGGGVMFNDQTTPEGLATISAAHRATGTRAFLPTLITDTPARSRMAVLAVEEAIARGIAGVLGLHLEGPHLDPRRKGAHDAALIRPMSDEDLAFLCDAAKRLPNLMVTLAPEATTADQIARLAEAGVIVSLGHSDCTAEAAQQAIAAGAIAITHLFNAMSQLSGRMPGLVGTALTAPVTAGLIADGIHVHPLSIRAALNAKGAGGLFLVTDAMATVGAEITEFSLNGRRVLRRDGRLTLEDGTLAGADLDLPRALRVMTWDVGLPLEKGLAMATGIPASLLRAPQGVGRLEDGGPWHAIHLDDGLRYRPLPD